MRLLRVLVLALMVVAGPAHAASVVLEWDASVSTDVYGYRVYQSTVKGTYNKTTGKVCDVTASTSSCTVSSLTDGTTYYWVATAYDSGYNESGYSNEVTQRIDFTAPTPPVLRIKSISSAWNMTGWSFVAGLRW